MSAFGDLKVCKKKTTKCIFKNLPRFMYLYDIYYSPYNLGRLINHNFMRIGKNKAFSIF